MHQAKRQLAASVDAALDERELVAEQRRRQLERELDEPDYIEIRRDRGGYEDY
jgi:hypothetical protein